MNSYPKMYIIPGLGTDGRIFQQLRLQNLDFEVVEWETPEKNEPYETYLQRMAEKIRTDEPFVLAGVSFGGMCAQSLAPQLKPEKLVLISTIRRPDQFPFYLRHAIQLKMNRWVDGPTIKFFAKLVLPIRSNAKFPDGRRVSSIVDQADPYLLKWSIDKAAEWQSVDWNGPTLHLHGDKDILFPISLQGEVTPIKGGNHLAIFEKAEEIAERIKDFVRQ